METKFPDRRHPEGGRSGAVWLPCAHTDVRVNLARGGCAFFPHRAGCPQLPTALPDRDKGFHMRTTPGGSASILWGALYVILYTVNIWLGFQAALALTPLWWLSEIGALSVYFKDCSMLFASVQEGLLRRCEFSIFYD